MTTSILLGNNGGHTSPLCVYYQPLDPEGEPTGELIPALTIEQGQFSGSQLAVHSGARLVIYEGPAERVAKDAVSATSAAG